MAICYCGHHSLVLTIIMVMVPLPTSAEERHPELSRGPFCAIVRAVRECGNENLPGPPDGSFCAIARAGRGG
eukprot:13166755-Alexandrium_andersonii.AAC.1